jgi:hypothetical protein
MERSRTYLISFVCSVCREGLVRISAWALVIMLVGLDPKFLLSLLLFVGAGMIHS